LPIGQWFIGRARAHGAFESRWRTWPSGSSPSSTNPTIPAPAVHQKHTQDWSAAVDRSDAFVFVTPEYNYGYPATLKNAIDFLHYEWMYKPVGLFLWGIAAGTRSVQQLKQVSPP